MIVPFDLLRVGDALFFDAVEYIAVGSMTLRTAEDDEWREWLLVPHDIRAEEALRTDRHRWLSHEPGDGLRLWSPIALPDNVDAASLKIGHRLRYRDRDYRVEDRYRFRPAAILGDVGDDATTQESFDAVDLRSGPHLLSIEWNARGVDATLGRKIGSHELLRWSREAGGACPIRVRDAGSKVARASGAVGKDDEPSSVFSIRHPLWQWISWGAVFLVVILLQQCDSGSDCEQRLNPATGQYATYCEDGIRSGGSRNFGSWGGK